MIRQFLALVFGNLYKRLGFVNYRGPACKELFGSARVAIVCSTAEDGTLSSVQASSLAAQRKPRPSGTLGGARERAQAETEKFHATRPEATEGKRGCASPRRTISFSSREWLGRHSRYRFLSTPL
jgi:hypothetical protein